MIIQGSTHQLHKSEGTTDSQFKITASATAFHILSSGLYSNKIGAIVRELFFNARDSHIAAGRPKHPVDIHLPSSESPVFYVQDYGVGLSPDDVNHIFTTYFESTKSQSNDFVGALGLGSKSPFSYVDVFSVTSNWEGTQYIYSMFLNEEGVPSVSLLGSMPTTEHNGLKIEMAVEEDDFREFAYEIIEQLILVDVAPNLINDEREIGKLLHQKRDELSKSNSYKTGPLSIVNTTVDEVARHLVIQGGVKYPIDINRVFGSGRKNSTLSEQSNLNKLVMRFFNDLRGKYVHIEVPLGSCSFAASREELSYDNITRRYLMNALQEWSDALYDEMQSAINVICDSSHLNRKMLATVLTADPTKVSSILPRFNCHHITVNDYFGVNATSEETTPSIHAIHGYLSNWVEYAALLQQEYGEFKYKGEPLSKFAHDVDALKVDISKLKPLIEDGVAIRSIVVEARIHRNFVNKASVTTIDSSNVKAPQIVADRSSTILVIDDADRRPNTVLMNKLRMTHMLNGIIPAVDNKHIILIQSVRYDSTRVQVDESDELVQAAMKLLDIDSDEVYKLSDLLQIGDFDSFATANNVDDDGRVRERVPLRLWTGFLTQSTSYWNRQPTVRRKYSSSNWEKVDDADIASALEAGREIYYVATRNSAVQSSTSGSSKEVRYFDLLLKYAATSGIIPHNAMIVGVPIQHITGKTSNGRSAPLADLSDMTDLFEHIKDHSSPLVVESSKADLLASITSADCPDWIKDEADENQLSWLRWIVRDMRDLAMIGSIAPKEDQTDVVLTLSEVARTLASKADSSSRTNNNSSAILGFITECKSLGIDIGFTERDDDIVDAIQTSNTILDQLLPAVGGNVEQLIRMLRRLYSSDVAWMVRILSNAAKQNIDLLRD